MMLSPGYGCRAGGRHSASTPLGTQWTGTLGYFAESTAASWGVLAMTPSAARTVSRSSRGTRTPNSRVWTTGWDSQAFEWRSEEHTSELQPRSDLVCRLL